MKKYSLSQLILVTVLLFASRAYAVGFDAQTVQLQWLFPDISTVVYTENAFVTSGIEFPSITVNTVSYPLDIDISDNQITVATTEDRFFELESFNGFRFTDINGTIEDIIGVTINPSTVFAGLDASRISFDADNIWINFSGLPNDSLSSTAIFDVSFSSTPVPEPATMLLLASGLVGLVGFRKKFRKS